MGAVILRDMKLAVLCVLLGIWIPIEAAAQTLNMSHDLVRLGIAGQNLTPDNPSLDARPLFQAALQYVQSHPVQLLTLDQGNYYLLTAQQKQRHIVIPVPQQCHH